MSESKICKSCGGINEIDEKRCKYCGNSLFIVKQDKYYLEGSEKRITITNDLFIERKDFESQYISNKHAYLFVRNDKLFVRDLNSTNGTFINDEKIDSLTDHELVYDDKIVFADLEFKVGVAS